MWAWKKNLNKQKILLNQRKHNTIK